MLDDLEYAALGFETFHENVLAPLVVVESAPLEISAHQCAEHIRPSEARGRKFDPVSIGWRWGPVWSTSWFRVNGDIPASMRDQPLVLHFSSGTEALLYRDDTTGADDGGQAFQPLVARRVPPRGAPAVCEDLVPNQGWEGRG